MSLEHPFITSTLLKYHSLSLYDRDLTRSLWAASLTCETVLINKEISYTRIPLDKKPQRIILSFEKRMFLRLIRTNLNPPYQITMASKDNTNFAEKLTFIAA